MKKLLVIESGINKSASHSRNLSQEFTENWKHHNPNGQIIIRDVTNPMLPHLDDKTLAGFFTPADQQTEETKEAARLSDTLVNEFIEADVVVLGAPVYNFGIPSTLKAYFDHISRAGITFQYTDAGPQGLVTGKKVYVITTRGSFAASETNVHQQYLSQFLGFLGLNDVQFIEADGLAIDDQTRDQKLSEVRKEIQKLTAA